MGAGNFAVVHVVTVAPKRIKQPAAAAVTATATAPEEAVTAPAPAGVQKPQKYAIKVIDNAIGKPGSDEFKEWSSPLGQAVLQQNTHTELSVLQMVKAERLFMTLFAIGELAPPGGSRAAAAVASQRSSTAGPASTQPLRCAVLELGTCLANVVNSKSQYPIPEDHIKGRVDCVARGIALLHSGRLCLNGKRFIVVHRDVAVKNVLLTTKKICLADFGSAALIPVDIEDSSSEHHSDSESDDDQPVVALDRIIGTQVYMAPEIAQHYEQHVAATKQQPGQLVADLPPLRYDSSVDMWSLGVLTMVMYGGGLERMAAVLKAPDGVKPSAHMVDVVTRFVNGQLFIGQITAENVEKYADARHFVACCCGIGMPRMTAAALLEPATRPAWLPQLRRQK